MLYLSREGFNIVKFALGAQKFVKIYARLMTVEISPEIQQEALDIDIARFAHRRAYTYICDRHVLLPVDIRLCSVNSVARDDDALGKAHVDSRSAHLRSEVVAAADNIGERVRMAVVLIRLFLLAVLDERSF